MQNQSQNKDSVETNKTEQEFLVEMQQVWEQLKTATTDKPKDQTNNPGDKNA